MHNDSGTLIKTVQPQMHMKQRFHVIIEQEKDGTFIGTVPELQGCHTQGETLDELMKHIREAGIKKVKYTNWNGEWEEFNIQDMQ